MKALLLVAHGSRREQSNAEVLAVADRLAAAAGERFGLVKAAYLELAAPSIPEGVEQCIQAGATEVVVLPYFLSAGRHVAEDIPAEVAGKQEQYPNVVVRIAPYLGSADGLVTSLLELADD